MIEYGLGVAGSCWCLELTSTVWDFKFITFFSIYPITGPFWRHLSPFCSPRGISRIAKLGCQFQRHLQVISKTLFQPSPGLGSLWSSSLPEAFAVAFQSSEWPMPSHASGHRKAGYQPGTSFPPFYFSQSLTHTSKPSSNALFSVEPDSARGYCSSFVPPLNYSVFIFT